MWLVVQLYNWYVNDTKDECFCYTWFTAQYLRTKLRTNSLYSFGPASSYETTLNNYNDIMYCHLGPLIPLSHFKF